MTFHRTPSGLANLHLFYRVDAIVFVEGGDPSCSLADIIDGVYDTVSQDIRFWSIILGAYAPLRRFQFRAIGSKLNLLALADYIAANSIANVLVCMDRDADDVTGTMRTSNAVLYTRGYSWENDVWIPSTVTAIFYDVCVVAKTGLDVRAHIEEAFRHFSASIRGVIKADILLLQNGMDGINRSAIRSSLRTSKHTAPSIDCGHLRRAIRERRKVVSDSICRTSTRPVKPLADCYGHLQAEFAFHVLVHLLRKHCKMKTIPKHLISAAALTRFELQLAQNALADGYYRPSVAALKI